MHDIRNCLSCGTIFRFRGKSLCPVCLQKEENEYDGVYLYSREHPGIRIEELCQATGIPMERVLSFLREGRLEGCGITVEDGFLTCDACGAPVCSSGLCPDCRLKLTMDISRNIAERNLMQQTKTLHNTYPAARGVMYTAHHFTKE